MHEKLEKPKENKNRAVSNSVTQDKSSVKQGFGFVDNRPEAIAQRKLKEMMNNGSTVRQLRSFQDSSGNSRQEDIKALQLQKIKANEPNEKESSVVQLAGWTKEKVKDYKHWLRKRAKARWDKGKRKNSLKLVRKYVKARMKVPKLKESDPDWSPRLADTPTAGHHVPPLALSNEHGGAFKFGVRGLKGEKSRSRVYFSGGSSERKEAHWFAHEAEAMQGLNRQSTFSGTDLDLGDRMMAAHHGLTLMNGTAINVESRSQLDPSTGAVKPIGDATRSILESQSGLKHALIDDDSTDSEPDSDFEGLDYDSDTH